MNNLHPFIQINEYYANKLCTLFDLYTGKTDVSVNRTQSTVVFVMNVILFTVLKVGPQILS